jgi:hypothetical protein
VYLSAGFIALLVLVGLFIDAGCAVILLILAIIAVWIGVA